MKRAVIGAVGVAAVAALLIVALKQQQQKPQSAPNTATAQQAPVEKIVFTFADDAQIQRFGELWAERQASVTRQAVMRSYWDAEQADLDNVNNKLNQQFGMDVNKEYTLDTDRKVLIERPAPAPDAAASAPADGAQSQAVADQSQSRQPASVAN